MANTVVTVTANAIKLVLNDDSFKYGGIRKVTWAKSHLAEVKENGGVVEVTLDDSNTVYFQHTTGANSHALIIDSMDAGATDVSTLDNVYNALSYLLE